MAPAHYTNQGSRPSGAIREGKWKLVEHYADGRAELFDLENDIGEVHDLSTTQPARTAALLRQLREWRASVGAQENRPNAEFDLDLYESIYVDFDASRFDPLKATTGDWEAVARWRKLMNAESGAKTGLQRRPAVANPP